MKYGKAVNVVYLDVIKSLNTVSHYILVARLNYGLDNWAMR